MTAKVVKSSGRGSKPGERRGGRVKGQPNKKTAALVAAVEASGVTPLEYMLQVLRDPSAQIDRRDDMARAAAPYVHPKLAAVEHSGPEGGTIPMSLVIEFVRAGGKVK